MTLRSADFESLVHVPYRHVPAYMAIYSGKSTIMERPAGRGIPAHTVIYRAIRRKQPPCKVSAGRGGSEELHP
jgi:hypothetical protein